ncbi:MAG: calcium/sodium antiporter [Pseudomonadota bacterium]
MEMLTAIGMLIGGFAILLIGGESLVKAAVSLALRWKISPALIGLTVIAAGTSAPELFTSITAALKGANDIALGNVVGSNIFNLLAILGVASIIKPNKVQRRAITIEIPFLLVASISMIVFAYDGLIARFEGGILVTALIGFLYYSFVENKKGNQEVDGSDEIDNDSLLKNMYWDLGHLFIGFAALLGGAQLALEGGIELGTIFGLSERIIGVTIISVGTGLPELATSAVAAFRGRNDIAVSNVIGSNLMNTLAVIGTTSMIRPMPASEKIITSDCVWMVAGLFIVFPIFFLGRGTVGRSMGVFLLFGYISYLGFLISTP